MFYFAVLYYENLTQDFQLLQNKMGLYCMRDKTKSAPI